MFRYYLFLRCVVFFFFSFSSSLFHSFRSFCWFLMMVSVIKWDRFVETMSLDECVFCRGWSNCWDSFVRVNEWRLKILTEKHTKQMWSNNNSTFRQMAICHSVPITVIAIKSNRKFWNDMHTNFLNFKSKPIHHEKKRRNNERKATNIDTVRNELWDNHLDSIPCSQN